MLVLVVPLPVAALLKLRRHNLSTELARHQGLGESAEDDQHERAEETGRHILRSYEVGVASEVKCNKQAGNGSRLGSAESRIERKFFEEPQIIKYIENFSVRYY